MRSILIAAGLMAAAAAAVVERRGAPPQDADVQAQIDQVLQAYGGMEALEGVTSYRMEGTISTRSRGHGEFSRLVVRPGRLDVVLDYGVHREVRLLSDGEGRRASGDAALAAVEGPLLGSMKLQAARSMIPWILDTRRDDVRAIEPLEQGGRSFPGLELALEDGLALRVYSDPESHYVVQSQGLLSMAGMATHFETMYADHRKVDGVLFAMREANFASGMATAWTTVETVTLNPDLASDGATPEPR